MPDIVPGAILRFSVFEVDLRSGELRKRGIRVPLQHQPFRILVRLLARPGELVTRDELRQELWPAGTYVDFAQGLNGAVKRLREALGDSAETPRFVETVPKQGYRFIAPVRSLTRAKDETGGVLRASADGRLRLVAAARQNRLLLVAVLITLLGLGVGAAVFIHPSPGRITAGRQINVERALAAPLEYVNLPQALEIVGNAPDTIDIRVRASSAVLSQIQPGDITAVLDLKTARKGLRRFHINTNALRVPAGVEITQVNPSSVVLQLEELVRRWVPVVVAIQGEPAPGFKVDRIIVEPAEIEIIGPETRIGQVTEAITEAVSVAGARARLRDTVAIGLGDASVRLVGPQAARVTVNIIAANIH